MSADVPRPTLVWFRQDLRLADNPALAAAWARGGPVIPVYIRDDAGEGDWPAGAASRWWLHHSLRSLGAAIAERGGRLVLARGDSAAVLRELIGQTGADAVYWNRRYEPGPMARDAKWQAQCGRDGIEAREFNAALLFEPTEVRNRSGGPFQVFGPYWRHCLSLPVASPVRLPAGAWPASASGARSLDLEELELLPNPERTAGFAAAWQPGEPEGRRRLREFVGRGMDRYAEARDQPAVAGTSALSPHLHFGEVGPRQVWAAVRSRSSDSGIFPINAGAQRFLTELGWREFAYHLLHHFPRTPAEPLRGEFARFPWRSDPGQLAAWQQGRTGYPIVDAGMRQLRQTGMMHNRVRMVVASFLVKHLRLSWREGAAWFWDSLVDADLAANTLGWQWTAGCGADAAPYFRIFNPTLQGEKFDPDGAYVVRWVPELRQLPARYVHRPWEAPHEVLAAAGIDLGRDYPRPIVEHAAARAEALAALQSLRTGRD